MLFSENCPICNKKLQIKYGVLNNSFITCISSSHSFKSLYRKGACDQLWITFHNLELDILLPLSFVVGFYYTQNDINTYVSVKQLELSFPEILDPINNKKYVSNLIKKHF